MMFTSLEDRRYLLSPWLLARELRLNDYYFYNTVCNDLSA